MARTNPLKADALTADTVTPGDRIVVWRPLTPGSARRYTVLGSPHTDDDGTMVIHLRNESDADVTISTSEAGLTGSRYDGKWSHIAVIDDPE